MKKKINHLFILAFLIAALLTTGIANAQQYKLRQVSNMMQMKIESTIYVKGMRKRTEGGTLPGMGASLVTIEQCDQQRTITLNDKKKLYYIEPFAGNDDVTIEDTKAAPAPKKLPVARTSTQQGGVIHMYYSITDTGERKKIYGFTARHVWTTQKIKPSADACYMKDSMLIKTDGWYIDLPEFNCPVRYSPGGMNGGYQKPDCRDRYVSKVSGKGKLGFPLQETRTIIMGNGQSVSSGFETTLETLELTTAKPDSMLFEIPPGYTAARSMEELQEKPDMAALAGQRNSNFSENQYRSSTVAETKKEGMIRIGVYVPVGENPANMESLQQFIITTLHSSSIEAVALSTPEDVKKYNCDYTLKTDFVRTRQAGKVGGLLKAIKNADPGAATSFSIELNLSLIKVKDGTLFLQPKINGKYPGGAVEAARKALAEGFHEIINGIK